MTDAGGTSNFGGGWHAGRIARQNAWPREFAIRCNAETSGNRKIRRQLDLFAGAIRMRDYGWRVAMSDSKVELWLIRHGETEWSLDGRHTSVTDIPLTDRGRERARELRDFLDRRKFAAVFVSPMQRAKETCKIAGYGDVAIEDQNLMEWN